MICSNKNYLKTELEHLQEVFKTKNGYPNWLISQVEKEVRTNIQKQPTKDDTQKTNHMMILPYKGQQGEQTLKRLKTKIQKCFQKITIQILFFRYKTQFKIQS